MKCQNLFAAALFFSVTLHAQTDSSSAENKIQITPGLQFNNNQSYAGRTDSLKLPVLMPEANFTLGKGLFVNAKGYINLSQHTTTFDGISIEPGYEFSKKSWNGSISLIKNFISDSSNLIIAPVKASLEFYLNKETNLVTPYVGWEYAFSNTSNDFILYGGVSRDVAFTKENKKFSVDVEPSVSVTAGSQGFYYSYLTWYSTKGNSGGKRKGRGSGNGSTASSQLVEQDSQKFTLLASAIELPLTIKTQKIKWITTPALEAPVNLVKGVADVQSASSFFCITTELLLSF